MSDAPQATVPTVSFTSMAAGTREDYELLERLEAEFASGTGDRVLDQLRGLAGSLAGYKVDRLEHSLQSATRAYRDGADNEMVVAALLCTTSAICWRRTTIVKWPLPSSGRTFLSGLTGWSNSTACSRAITMRTTWAATAMLETDISTTRGTGMRWISATVGINRHLTPNTTPSPWTFSSRWFVGCSIGNPSALGVNKHELGRQSRSDYWRRRHAWRGPRHSAQAGIPGCSGSHNGRSPTR